MSKKLLGDLGQAIYKASCHHKTDQATVARVVNELVAVLDDRGEHFRYFLRACGASDEEQARGEMEG